MKRTDATIWYNDMEVEVDFSYTVSVEEYPNNHPDDPIKCRYNEYIIMIHSVKEDGLDVPYVDRVVEDLIEDYLENHGN